MTCPRSHFSCGLNFGERFLAYLIANEYQKALGLSEPDESVEQVAQRYMDAAARYGQVKDLVYHIDGSFDDGERSKEVTGGDRAAVRFNLFVRAVARSTIWK